MQGTQLNPYPATKSLGFCAQPHSYADPELDQETNFGTFSAWGTDSLKTIPKLKPTFVRLLGTSQSHLKGGAPAPRKCGGARAPAPSLLAAPTPNPPRGEVTPSPVCALCPG